MLADIAREGTSVPPVDDAVFSGKLMVIGCLLFLVGITAGLMKWTETQYVLYVLGVAALLCSAAICFEVL